VLHSICAVVLGRKGGEAILLSAALQENVFEAKGQRNERVYVKRGVGVPGNGLRWKAGSDEKIKG
jgi:hypothetical protein